MSDGEGRPPIEKRGGNEPGKRVPRPRLPPRSSVLSESTIVSPKGARYRILRSSERDATDDDKER